MKIAVLTDIHANFVALQAVTEHIEAWQPDEVIVGGDLVNRGPRPAECLAFVEEKQRIDGWRVIRGNHEDYVIHQARPDTPQHGPVFDVHRASYWTYEQLNCDVSGLEALPIQIDFRAPDKGLVRTVHASMRGSRVGIYPDATDHELWQLIRPVKGRVPELFCVGHTHLPLIRRLDQTLVVNAGSAGLPFDGDPRPSYARLTWQRSGWQAEIVRVEYDLPAAEQDFYTSGYLSGGGPLVRVVQVELREARSMLYYWASRYQELALRGEISMEESVQQFLQS